MNNKRVQPNLDKSWMDDSLQLRVKIEIKPYTLKELRSIYNVSKAVMAGWMERVYPKMDKKKGYYFTAKEVEFIVNELGLPYTVLEKEPS